MVGSVYDLVLADIIPESGAVVTVPIYDGRENLEIPGCFDEDCIRKIKHNNYTGRTVIETNRGKKYNLKIKSSGSMIKTKYLILLK